MRIIQYFMMMESSSLNGKEEVKKIVCEISVGAFYDICNGLYDKTEINNRINDFILQQLYLKGVELE